MAQALQDIRQMAAESQTWNTRLLGHHDLNGYGDGMQVVKNGQFAYVAHVGTTDMALSVIDVSDPENPRLLRQFPKEKNSHSHKVQIVGNVMIQNGEYINYVKTTDDDPPKTGMYVYNIDDPINPRLTAFYDVMGDRGVHRMWFRDAPYAHVAAQVDGRPTRGYQILDLSDPNNPRMAGRWWVPGTFPDDPDPWQPLDPEQNHYAVHGAIPCGDRSYVSCTDAGLVVLDISDISRPKFVSRLNWCPPYAGYSHTSLPLPERGLLVEVCEAHGGPRERTIDRRIWMIDIRDDRQPVMASTFPKPTPPKGSGWETYHDRPGRFGPHNIHENYAEGLVSETLIFSTWFNAGVRITDISDPFRPEEVGFFIHPSPPGQESPQANDLYVDKDGLVYATDRVNGGLYIFEYTGGGLA